MFHDLSLGEAASIRHCDLLILGAGPAGITLAIEVSKAAPGMTIVLAEAGGLERSDSSELRLYDGESSGDSEYPINATRLRYFGGTSGHWGGWCKPLDEIDFADRPAAGSVGWPLDAAELQAHYAAAADWLELGSPDFNTAHLQGAVRNSLLDFSSNEWFCNRMFRLSPPTRFGERYREQISDSKQIDCLLNAAAVSYAMRGRRLHEVSLSGLHGNRVKVQADRVVVAMGGIESTRHLLFMQSQGWLLPGFTSGHLGAGFADHFGPQPGMLTLPAGLKYLRSRSDDLPVMPIITPTEHALRQHNWRNACMLLHPSHKQTVLPREYLQQRLFAGTEHWHYMTQLILEPARNPASQIKLATDKDALGLPRVQLHWDILADDYRSGLDIYTKLVKTLSTQGIGRGQLRQLNPEQLRRNGNAVAHHMGSTRMAAKAEHGVVDRNLRVFGSDNLYVVSSAVFPSFGYSNPTMTIVALAHRLAQHLRN